MIEGGPTHRLLVDETVEISDGDRFYGDTFERCHLKRAPTTDPLFLLCVLKDCTFDPPFRVEHADSWRCLRRYGCIVLNEAG